MKTLIKRILENPFQVGYNLRLYCRKWNILKILLASGDQVNKRCFLRLIPAIKLPQLVRFLFPKISDLTIPFLNLRQVSIGECINLSYIRRFKT